MIAPTQNRQNRVERSHRGTIVGNGIERDAVDRYGCRQHGAMASGFAEEITDRSMVPPLVIEASWEDKLSSFFAERVKALAASVKADWMSVRLLKRRQKDLTRCLRSMQARRLRNLLRGHFVHGRGQIVQLRFQRALVRV